MNSQRLFVKYLGCLLCCLTLPVLGQNVGLVCLQKSQPLSNEGLRSLTISTSAYDKEMLRLIIEEANHVARQLYLPETLPITEAQVIEKYITPPGLAQQLKAVGNITTSNYTYCMSVGNKFSFLVKRNLQEDYQALRERYLTPTSLMDTNSAYQLATQFLAAVSMDVAALSQDCDVRVLAFTPEGMAGGYFVPVYWVYWVPKVQDGHGSVASVELLGPSRSIRQMHVNRPQYILRKPLRVPNLAELLNQTNAPGTPPKTKQ